MRVGEEGGMRRPGGSGKGSSEVERRERGELRRGLERIEGHTRLTQYHHMPNPNILQRSSIGINENLVHLLQHVQTLANSSKDGMSRVEILDPSFSERDEELRATSTLRSWSDGHRDGSS